MRRRLALDAHVIVDGYNATNTDCRTGTCQHNENTDLTVFDIWWQATIDLSRL